MGDRNSCQSTFQLIYSSFTWTRNYYHCLNEDGLSPTDGRMALRASSFLRRPKEAKLDLFSALFASFERVTTLFPGSAEKNYKKFMYELFFTHRTFRVTSITQWVVLEILAGLFVMCPWNTDLITCYERETDWIQPCTWTRNVTTTVDSR